MIHRRVFLKTLCFIAVSSLFCMAMSSGAETLETPIASIRLYNPTSVKAETVVEIPVGSLGNPECLDWNKVQLRRNREKLPFSLREGTAHWRAGLTATERPSAEDLLVFTIAVAPGQWERLDIVFGSPDRQSALVRENGVLTITYPRMKVMVEEQTGQLTSIEAFGESVLRAPFRYHFYGVDEGTTESVTSVGPGYHFPAVTVKQGEKQPPPTVSLTSFSSTEAMTELHFTLTPQQGPSVGLTYRIDANRQIEILADERPWEGRSPWLNCCLEYELAVAGTSEKLPYLQSHFPYYGFKDYAASVRNIGTFYRGEKTFSFAWGEESANGRFWRRRLAFYPEQEYPKKDVLLQLWTHGLVVQAEPMSSQPLKEPLRLACSEEARSVGELFLEGLQKAGMNATLVTPFEKAVPSDILLRLTDHPAAVGIRGDGFSIFPVSDRKQIEIVAGTKLGLFQGASHVLHKMQVNAETWTVPLVANNPVVDLRCGGFGGGNFEVDFPYGDESEWKSVFDRLMASGMNVIACLGMWSNWKMPIRYKDMPELWSDDPEAYDELSGAKFVEFDLYHEKSLRLIQYLHDRGVKVWLWIPLGTIPTSFEEKYPEATTPTNRKVPRVTHPKYREFLQAYFREILELYPVDGFVLIRDDNGGLDDTEEYKEYIERSRTKSPAWEACLMAYDLIRAQNFQGAIAVYPYFDAYQPRLDPLLPKDLLIVGHGSGLSLLARHFDQVLPMGDTWLDNPYSGSFRLPSSLQMKSLLSDRNSFWIGGAFCGTELPWESLGYFGEQPTLSVSTFQYDVGLRTFGEKNAARFVMLSQSCESLWEIMRNRLLPHDWVKLEEQKRREIVKEGFDKLEEFRRQFRAFQNAVDQESNPEIHAKWFAHVGLYDSFFEYNLRRAEVFGKMEDLTVARQKADTNPLPLPESVRQEYLALNAEVDELARRFAQEASKVPGEMMTHTRLGGMTFPFKEWVMGYDPSLEFSMSVKQFAGRMEIRPCRLSPGEPFELSIELTNAGCVVWTPETGPRIELHGETERFGLPKQWDYEGEPMIYGDQRVITLHGIAPGGSGTEQVKIEIVAPFRNRVAFLEGTADLKWAGTD